MSEEKVVDYIFNHKFYDDENIRKDLNKKLNIRKKLREEKG